MGGVTLVRTRDSKLALALTAKYLWSASAWVRKPAPAMASSISVWVRELVQYWVNVGIQLGPRVEREKLVGHVALRLGLRVVIREIHVSQGVCDLLIDFGPRVEVQQSRDDFGIDLGAVVVAGQGRGDGRGHRAAGGVALSVDFDLEGVQGGLVGLGRQALSQAGVDSHEAGSIGQDGSLCCGETSVWSQ